jgi:thiazole/oxazole-forming peptide maturase SagD family component
MRSSPGGRRIVVIAEFPEDGNELADALSRAGIAPATRGRRAVVAARNILSEGLRQINSRMLQGKTPWLLVKTSGAEGWIGPLFVPGRTGCWECLAHRLLENQWRDEAEKSAPSTTLKLAVREIQKWLAGDAPEAQIRTVANPPDGSKVHILTRRPQCPRCGSRAVRSHVEIRLNTRVKSNQSERSSPLQQTLDRLAPFESELTGIVTPVPRTSRWTFPVYLGLHSRPLPPGGASQLPRQPVAGKGRSRDESRASCLAEAMERYSIQWQGDEARRTARIRDLPGLAFNLESLALWSERQLRARERWNSEVGGFNWITEGFAPDAQIDWTAVWSLTARRRRYVPTAYCYLYYPGPAYFADSNGCASGNVMEEAILHGFLELVERDAVGIWWYNRTARPAVMADGPVSSRFAKAERDLATRGRTLTVLDLTSDFDIPVFAAISARENGKGILIGTGAHLNPEAGVCRALGELCQLVDTLDERSARLHGRLTTVEAALRRWQGEHIRNHRYLVGSGASKKLSDFPDWSTADLKEEIEWCIGRARSLGLEILVLDMTRRDLNFPVARVIVPGMRHCWARLAPGRLYDVPVKLGWQARALKETDLNPTAYFL